MSAPDKSLRVLVLHGPNMNLVGKRPKEIFGTLTLDKINRSLRKKAGTLEVELKIFQSNAESALITLLQRQRNWADGLLVNPASLCFTCFSLLDTVQLVGLPTIEVHLIDTVAGRSTSESILSVACLRQVVGPVDSAYPKALERLVAYLRNSR